MIRLKFSAHFVKTYFFLDITKLVARDCEYSVFIIGQRAFNLREVLDFVVLIPKGN